MSIPLRSCAHRVAPESRGSSSSSPIAVARRWPASARSIRIEDSGPDRFATVADRWRSLSAKAVADSPGEQGGGGPIAVGGFAFAPDGGSSPAWSGFEPASLVVPEVTFTREQHDGEHRVRLTLAALVQPDDTAEELLGASTAA